MILLYLNYALFFFFAYFFMDRRNHLEYIVICLFLTSVHFLFGYLNVLASQEKIVDSINYYNWGTTAYLKYFDFSIGTSFLVHLVNWLSVFFSNFEQMSAFFTGSTLLIFLKIFSIVYERYSNKNIKFSDYVIILFFLFLPGFHYWTVSLGKDSLMLIAIFWGFWSFYKKNLTILILSCLLMFFVRVHMFAIFILSLMVSEYIYAYFNFLRVNKKTYKFSLLSISIPFSLGMFYFLFNYIQKYSKDGFSNIDEFLDGRAEVYADLGSGAWLSVQPYPIKVFAFVFGGVPWKSLDALTIASMVESFILFFIGGYIFFSLKRNFKYYALHDKALTISALFFILVSILFFSLTNNNLGVMVRMKVMIYSPLLLLTIIVLSNKYQRTSV